MAHTSFRIRPMSISDLLDTVFWLYRRHFWFFVGIVAVVQVPLTSFQVGYEMLLGPAERLQTVTGDYYNYYADMWSLMLIRLLFSLVSFFAVQGLMSGAMARAIYDRYQGRSLGLVETYRSVGGRWLRLVGAFLLLGMLDAAIFLLLIIPCLGWVAAPILLIFVNVPILSLLAPIVVLEDMGASLALRRAFRLGRQKFWRVLGVNILLALLTLVVSGTLPALFGFAVAFLQPSFVVQTVTISLLALVVELLVRPIWLCGLTLLYFDLRSRLEGFDLALRAAQAERELAEAGAGASFV